jgi:hypothetical protein
MKLRGISKLRDSEQNATRSSSTEEFTKVMKETSQPSEVAVAEFKL